MNKKGGGVGIIYMFTCLHAMQVFKLIKECCRYICYWWLSEEYKRFSVNILYMQGYFRRVLFAHILLCFNFKKIRPDWIWTSDDGAKIKRGRILTIFWFWLYINYNVFNAIYISSHGDPGKYRSTVMKSDHLALFLRTLGKRLESRYWPKWNYI